jgi:GAF domain-containing protein
MAKSSEEKKNESKISKLHEQIQQSLVYVLAAVMLIVGVWAAKTVERIFEKLDKVDYKINTVKEFEATQLIADAKRDVQVQETLAELRVRTNGDRSILFLLHNTGHWATGSAMKKYSAAYESTGKGVSEASSGLQSILLSQNPQQTLSLADREVRIIDISSTDNENIKRRTEYMGTKKILAITIYIRGDTPIGFLSVHYTRDYEVTEEDKVLLVDAGRVISQLFERSLKQEAKSD